MSQNDSARYRSPSRKRRLAVMLVVASCVFAGWTAIARATTYYVDCSAATNGSGTSTGSPWNSISSVNATTFSAGDSILFKRGTGTSCSGMLTPGGSGTSTSPITIDAYGTGAQPVIAGGSNQAAVKLLDQSYWNVNNLELTGGNPYGLLITGDVASSTLHHFHVTDVYVHNVNGNATTADGGGIVIAPGANQETMDDVVVNGATVDDTNQWSGIRVGASGSSAPFNGASQALSTNVTVENSTVHDVWGSGITVFEANGATLQSNVAYNTGLMPEASWNSNLPTPNGIWAWYCHNCVTQDNESYGDKTPWVDGGDFDIDTFSQNQTVQYNYGHDSEGYCVAILGAESYTTTDSVVRYNICSNNGQVNFGSLDYSFITPGDIFILTWDSGEINGVQVYNNSFYWNPVSNQPLLYNAGSFTGSDPDFFKNNLIYATSDDLVNSNNSLSLDNNLWYTTNASQSYDYNGTTYSDWGSYTSGSGQDSHGMYANPMVNSPTYHSNGAPTSAFTLQSGSPAIDRGATISGAPSTDFFGDSAPQGNGTDIGADESSYSANTTTGLTSIDAGGGSSSWFAADDDYSGGSTFSTTHAIDTSAVGAPAPQAVYQSERYGTFTYTVGGLSANSGYLVRLHESENYFSSAGQREFDVVANGTQVLTNYDIYAAAGGEYKAVVAEFYVVSDSSGRIVLNFVPGAANQPKVDGIEIDQGTPGSSAINAGGPTDQWFVADTGYSGGSTYSTSNSIDTSHIGAPAPSAVYQTERYGSFTYTVTGLTTGHQYLVRLHESENFWTGSGDREFNVVANGTQVLTNYDIYAAAGGEYKAVVPEFWVTANASGNIVLQFTTGAADAPKVDGVEVLQ